MDSYKQCNNQMSQSEQEEDEVRGVPALIPLQVSQVEFYSDVIQAVPVEVNREPLVMVPLPQFCHYLEVDWSGQRRHVMRDDVLAAEVIGVAVPTTQIHKRGYYNRPVLCLPLDRLPGWLFGITSSRVRPALAPKLHQYRKECFRVLWQALQQGCLWQNTQEIVSSEEEIYSWLARVKDRVWRARERTIQVQFPATLTVEQWLRTLEHFRWKCAHCKQQPGVIIEHFIPLPLAGTTAENCVPSRYVCNSKKGNIHPDFVTTIPRQAVENIQSYLFSISGQDEQRSVKLGETALF